MKKFQSFVYRALKITLVSVLISTTLLISVVEAPLVHTAWMRQYVGSRVVKVTDESGKSGGTGFHIVLPSGKTVVMTNSHVCEIGKTDGYVWVHPSLDDVYKLKRKILFNSRTTDICIVEPLPGVSGLMVKDHDLSPGEHVYVLGHPKLLPLTKAEGEITSEEIVSVISFLVVNDADKQRCVSEPKFSLEKFNSFFGEMTACVTRLDSYLTNISIYPGNSGSPVVDELGMVITIVYAGDSGTNWGIFLAHSELMKFLSQQPF